MNILDVIRQGGVVLYPSDTLWGLGGDATNPAVARRIAQIKGRPPEKGFVILVSDLEMLGRYVEKIPAIAADFLEKQTRPTTIVYPAGRNLPPEVMAPDGSVAIRVVRKGFARDLIKAVGLPLISTSANFSGEPAPLTFNEIDKRFLDLVDYVVNLHRQKITDRPSRIVRVYTDDTFEILRP